MGQNHAHCSAGCSQPCVGCNAGCSQRCARLHQSQDDDGIPVQLTQTERVLGDFPGSDSAQGDFDTVAQRDAMQEKVSHPRFASGTENQNCSNLPKSHGIKKHNGMTVPLSSIGPPKRQKTPPRKRSNSQTQLYQTGRTFNQMAKDRNKAAARKQENAQAMTRSRSVSSDRASKADDQENGKPNSDCTNSEVDSASKPDGK
eukprot:gnl/MRDRNA2_/MRDRNA2_104625_c0_seq1.p1 gnl/MRDRNA2_/MRDRNA2_104625_c0~~gnl/MRDRNA2_/MRDRNA2_104625_c0_seq1.p1  ORF type:complete len:201 (-),score=33.98 gnl/MRDRNA2_/MRDRNA2_104625_c0_seq1:207-809(-)